MTVKAVLDRVAKTGVVMWDFASSPVTLESLMPKPHVHSRALYSTKCACGHVFTEVESFPDRTKAKTVNRFAPSLTFAELEILEACSALFVSFQGSQARMAGALAARGLLERAYGWRVSTAGADVLQLWKNAGFKP